MNQTSLPNSTQNPIDDLPSSSKGVGRDMFARALPAVPTTPNAPAPIGQPAPVQSQPITPTPTPISSQTDAVVVLPPLARYYTSTVNLTAESLIIVGANKRRRYLALQNIGSGDVWLSFGSPARIADCMKMPINSVWTFESGFVAENELFAAAVGGGVLAITEGSV